jgi:hypothetical protein
MAQIPGYFCNPRCGKNSTQESVPAPTHLLARERRALSASGSLVLGCVSLIEGDPYARTARRSRRSFYRSRCLYRRLVYNNVAWTYPYRSFGRCILRYTPVSLCIRNGMGGRRKICRPYTESDSSLEITPQQQRRRRKRIGKIIRWPHQIDPTQRGRVHADYMPIGEVRHNRKRKTRIWLRFSAPTKNLPIYMRFGSINW